MPSYSGVPIIHKVEGKISGSGEFKGEGFSVKYVSTGVYIVEFEHPFFYQPPEIKMTISDQVQGATTKIISRNLNSFKYFTIQMEPTKMYLKDFDVNFSAEGMID